MKLTAILSAMGFALIAALNSSAFAAGASAGDAEQVLRAMSAKLAASKHFTFSARRHLDAELHADYGVPEDATIDVSVERPNRINAHSVSRESTRRIVADGRTLTVFDEGKSFYAQVPMRGSIDQLIDTLDAVYGFTPPLAEFAVSDPYREFRQHAQAVSILGHAKMGGALGLGGIDCYRVALRGKIAEAELWVGVADQLPHKLVATFPRGGQLRITFSGWNLTAAGNPADFTFTAPKTAQKIEMWSTQKMLAARTR